MTEIVANLSSDSLQDLKVENIRIQKRGIPFILASVVIWGLISVIQLLPVAAINKNFYTFCCSPLLLPLAFLASKVFKSNLFGNKNNPLNSLGFIFTMNQMLYLLIVMWAFNSAPENMVMLYAMVFGAHLLPFGWLYNSRYYTIISIISTISSMLIGLYINSFAVALFIACIEIILTIALFIQNKRDSI